MRNLPRWCALHVKIDPNVCGGAPTIRELRITVDFLLKLVGDGHTAKAISRLYSPLDPDDLYQAARHGAWLASEQNSASYSFREQLPHEHA